MSHPLETVSKVVIAIPIYREKQSKKFVPYYEKIASVVPPSQ
jgi:hypothetical protein